MRRRALRLAVLLAVAAALARAEAQAPPRYAGRPLAEALADLQARGLKVIYSSDLVRPEMRVEAEPTATSLRRVLDQLLHPHGLTARRGPGGSLLVVKRSPGPILVTILSPRPPASALGEVEIAARVESEEEIEAVEFFVDGQRVGRVEDPPYRLRVDLGEDDRERRFTAVARGAFGGEGSDAVTVRPLVVVDRVEVSLRQLYVTASRGGRRVLDLGPEDFTILDGGVRQQLVTFERGRVPVTAALLLDASQSMRGPGIEAAVRGARSFLARLTAEDEALIMVFSDRTLALTPFFRGGSDAAPGLDGLSASGGTALNDHLYAALRLLDPQQGRRVAVLLSDGADVVSVLDIREVLWKVRRSDALIYLIQLQRQEPRASSFSSAWREVEGNRQQWQGLEAAVAESGGRLVALRDLGEVEAAFSTVLSELRDQYVLGYYPGEQRRDGTWRPVEVRVRRPGVRLRYRAGYIDR